MKRLLIIILSMFLFNCITRSQSEPKKYEFYFDIGYSFVPIDYISGPSLGLILTNEKYGISLGLSKTFLFKIKPDYYYDTTYQRRIYIDKFIVEKYHSLTYIDLEYNFKTHLNIPIHLGIGYGWIYLGKNDNIMFNRQNGYAVVSPKIRFTYSWVSFELRTMFNIQDEYYKRHYSYERLTGVQLSILYRFTPRTK